ncbi:Hypothetical protein, putative [Bodo saltans]|uniref:Uncharacterized protein n=1 Tax=Bodo saltans TaxID=75058 RepID=A0A0S4KI13_BODSA|nr:Hypothetical protein, putative [Bodo saltans]|eukprot:CUI15313.1 Hypothetical protein, putative [Bodo saltans]
MKARYSDRVRKMTTVEELSRALSKEKLTSKFFAESERSALNALEKVTQELKAVRKDLANRSSIQTELQHDLGVAAANISNLQQQCLLMQSELGDRVKEVVSLKENAKAVEKKHEAETSAAKNGQKSAEGKAKLLEAQVHVLSECVKGSHDPQLAVLPEKMSLSMDIDHWKRRAEIAEQRASSLEKELDQSRYLLREERMESQRANVLLVCNQRMVEYLNGSVTVAPTTATTAAADAPVLDSSQGSVKPAGFRRVLCTKEVQENLTKLEGVVKSLTVSQISEIVKDNEFLRRDLDRIRQELQAATTLATDRGTELGAAKKALEKAFSAAQSAENALTRQKANQIIIDREDKIRMLEQGSVASILMSFFTSPTRCPHCNGGLSDTLGLSLLANAAGCDSVDSLVNFMVITVAERSGIYRETFLDQVSAIVPPTTLAMAAQLVGPVPPGLMFFPPMHFAQFIESTQFISESQAYALAMQFLTVGARMVCRQEIVDDILDKIRFLWLSTALLESEITRLEGDILTFGLPPRRSGIAAGLVKSAAGSVVGSVMKQSAYHALMVPRSTLARLTQALRVRSTILQRHAAKSDAGRGPTSSSSQQQQQQLPSMLDDEKSPIVAELRRVRRSYVFLPKTVAVVGDHISLETLLQVQPLCV